jgi:predicted Fe-S protein YdhL (DUF1289 family)
MALFEQAHRPVPSPCIGICRLGGDGLCEGCHRTAEEIAGWLAYSDEQRRHLMNDVLPRRAERRGP